MKRVLLSLVIFTMIAGSLFALPADKPESDPISDDLMALQTANMLARYGYRVQSASALIGAAEILARIRVQPMGVQPERTQQVTTADTPEFTVTNLLADARRLAGRNRQLTSWANDVERAYNTVTRGPVGGPRFSNGIIGGLDSHTYHIQLRGGARSDVTLVGNGVSDLDLFLFDGAGRLVIASQGWDDVESVWVVPARTEVFTIVVRNFGRNNNRYQLFVD